MSEFVFLYRLDTSGAVGNEPSPQEMQERMKLWMGWMKGLEDKGHIVSAGHPLTWKEGAVMKDSKGTCTDGPYAETKDIVIGFTVIRAKDLDEAKKLSLGCPMLHAFGGGGLVEVRQVRQM
jgi:hypothetical protein